MAAQAGSFPAILVLLAHDAKADLRDFEGGTPLREAVYAAHAEAIRALSDAEADIELPIRDYSYMTQHNILKHMNIVTQQQIETIELLPDRG